MSVPVALRLLDNGFSPLPIPVGTKACYLKGWSRYFEQFPTEADIDAWASRWPECGWGIACGRVIGIDIDETDPDRAAELAALAIEIFGFTPGIRIGRGYTPAA